MQHRNTSQPTRAEISHQATIANTAAACAIEAATMFLWAAMIRNNPQLAGMSPGAAPRRHRMVRKAREQTVELAIRAAEAAASLDPHASDLAFAASYSAERCRQATTAGNADLYAIAAFSQAAGACEAAAAVDSKFDRAAEGLRTAATIIESLTIARDCRGVAGYAAEDEAAAAAASN